MLCLSSLSSTATNWVLPSSETSNLSVHGMSAIQVAESSHFESYCVFTIILAMSHFISITTLIRQPRCPSFNTVSHCLTLSLHEALDSLTSCPPSLSLINSKLALGSFHRLFHRSYVLLFPLLPTFNIFFFLILPLPLPSRPYSLLFFCPPVSPVALPSTFVWFLHFFPSDPLDSPLDSLSYSLSSQLPEVSADSTRRWPRIGSCMCEHWSCLGRAQTPRSPRRGFVPTRPQRDRVPLNCSQWTSFAGSVVLLEGIYILCLDADYSLVCHRCNMDFTPRDKFESAPGITNATMHFPHFLFMGNRNNREPKTNGFFFKQWR